jgi:RimJ/RimL family protein N-acetyltransferase
MAEAENAPARVVLETERLVLRELTDQDGEFILGLLNEPSFLRYVGDKGIRTMGDAQGYIASVPRANYARHGYGLYLVQLRASGEPMGICGLVNRDWLDAPDIGFSLLPAYWARGYAYEAARAVLHQAHSEFGLHRILAITNPENQDSIRLLRKLGFNYWKNVNTPDGREELSLWSTVGETQG